jgi:hypothetical protein
MKAYEMKTDLKMIRINVEAITRLTISAQTEMKYDDDVDRRGKDYLVLNDLYYDHK